MTEEIVHIRGLTKIFRTGWPRAEIRAVNGLDLEVSRGSVVALVGPNGAGKTTTIHALLGFLKPTAGSLRVFGLPADDPAVRRRIGYQSEIFYTYPFLSAREALLFYGRLSGLTHERLAGDIFPLLERLGLGPAADRRVETYSKGMMQRLGLAQALMHRPDLLILDEPTTGLDPEGRRLVAELILEEKSRGTTVFLSSHILSDVERTCDRVVMIRLGEVVFSDLISRLGRNSDAWEMDILGATSVQVQDLRQAGYECVDAPRGGQILIRCSSSQKKALLERLLAWPVDIGEVRRLGVSLEELYLKYVGTKFHE